MKELLWRWLAGVLSRPAVVDRLIAFAQRSPYLHIGSADGSDIYMYRFNLLPRWMLREIGPNAWRPKPWVPIHPRIHHIVREDLDREVHCHPGAFRTVILRGWYVEEDIRGHYALAVPGNMRYASREMFHRIDQVSARGAWTLFILGRRASEPWGFLAGDPPRLVPHRRYQSKNGRGDAIRPGCLRPK